MISSDGKKLARSDRTTASTSNGVVRPAKLRIALYSHDTMGIGHMRRHSLIAQLLSRGSSKAAILMVAGAREAGLFALPAGVDCLTLPALRKQSNGQYGSRRLAISLEELAALRSKTIRAALDAFDPDVLIVDNVPRGALRELDSTLAYLRSRSRTQCVLGLRDVLDDPAVIAREWRLAENEDANREYYDAVWVYGDTRVYDLVREYRWPADVAAKLIYTGYFDHRLRMRCDQNEGARLATALVAPDERLVLCLVGGGEDGAELAQAFARVEFAPGTHGLVLMGPYMPEATRRRLCALATSRPRFSVVDFITDPAALLSHADRIVAMGGYNTVYELLSWQKHALIVPRVRPRREQLVRAERLRDLGLISLLYPADLSPRAIADWLARDLGPAPRVTERIDMNGAARLPRLLRMVLARRFKSKPPEPEEVIDCVSG